MWKDINRNNCCVSLLSAWKAVGFVSIARSGSWAGKKEAARFGGVFACWEPGSGAAAIGYVCKVPKV